MDYQIMSGDIVTAEWIAGKLHILDEKHLPLFLKNFSDLHARLESRAIDRHRANSRLLKKALRLQNGMMSARYSPFTPQRSRIVTGSAQSEARLPMRISGLTATTFLTWRFTEATTVLTARLRHAAPKLRN